MLTVAVIKAQETSKSLLRVSIYLWICLTPTVPLGLILQNSISQPSCLSQMAEVLACATREPVSCCLPSFMKVS